jgi:hypothetical protein
MRAFLRLAALALAWAALPALASMPQFVSQGGRHALLVDGAPYTVLAAQLHNSSAWPAVLPEVWSSVAALHANTLEAPVYWEQFEPRPGQFDHANVDALVEGARAHGLHLILLWFGSWKNGQMHYAPAWIKADPARYPRALDEHGRPLEDLSPYAPANLEADRRAFAALMAHLKAIDGERHTVIMVQVENEPGLIGSVRDHSPEAERQSRQPLPAELARALHKPAGSWEQAFGADADEAFGAYGIARYIDQVAAAGKAVYPLPMYVNTWLRYESLFPLSKRPALSASGCQVVGRGAGLPGWQAKPRAAAWRPLADNPAGRVCLPACPRHHSVVDGRPLLRSSLACAQTAPGAGRLESGNRL